MLEMRTDGSGAGRTRVFTDPKQRCKAGTCRYDHADRPCYADPRERIELSFEMRPAAYKRILAQREDNAKWLRCKVEPFIQGAPRPAALAVSEDGLDPSGVGMTSWAFFANEGAPRDYVQARPGTGVDDTEPEPESDLDRRAESDSSPRFRARKFHVRRRITPEAKSWCMALAHAGGLQGRCGRAGRAPSLHDRRGTHLANGPRRRRRTGRVGASRGGAPAARHQGGLRPRRPECSRWTACPTRQRRRRLAGNAGVGRTGTGRTGAGTPVTRHQGGLRPRPRRP